VLGMRLEGSDFEMVSCGEGNKLLAVVARLCLPPRGCFSTLGIFINEEQRIRARLGICEWLRLLMRSKGFGLD